MKQQTEAPRPRRPDRVLSYFALEKWTLAVVTLSGIAYNLGMVAGPWFEGQLVQRLLDITAGKKTLGDMLRLATAYVAVIALVQAARFIKRLYVRKFANHINCGMKQALYANLLGKPRAVLQKDGTGSIMTKAIADVDTCVEGMRKFTTEVFDTGVVMVAYLGLLLLYDWRLTLLAMLFPPAAYLIAEKLKGVVSKSAAAYKKSAGRLNAATMDRVGNAMTYRVYGQEENAGQLYEKALTEYEKCATLANIWESALQPVYQILSTLGVAFILWFGAKNVLGSGWAAWDIAAFTTFLSCFMKLAVKSSKAAKLFNAVQKARVSWQRIKPYLTPEPDEKTPAILPPGPLALAVRGLGFRYADGDAPVFEKLSFDAAQGEILGVAGPVACGKSTLGRVFLCEAPYTGHITLNGVELSALCGETRQGVAAYMGHQTELLSASIEENILLGATGDVRPLLKAVCLAEEVAAMPAGIHTVVCRGGVQLSGGQQARLALARTLCHKKPLVILDDPFAAVDLETERRILQNIRPLLAGSIVLLLSHRLALFPQLDRVLWLGDGTVAPHAQLLAASAPYARAYRLQMGGDGDAKR